MIIDAERGGKCVSAEVLKRREKHEANANRPNFTNNDLPRIWLEHCCKELGLTVDEVARRLGFIQSGEDFPIYL